MTDHDDQEKTTRKLVNSRKSTNRRRLLKTIGAGGGAIVGAKSLPDKWVAPLVESVTLPAHAQTTPGGLIALSGGVANVVATGDGAEFRGFAEDGSAAERSILDAIVTPAHADDQDDQEEGGKDWFAYMEPHNSSGPGYYMLWVMMSHQHYAQKDPCWHQIVWTTEVHINQQNDSSWESDSSGSMCPTDECGVRGKKKAKKKRCGGPRRIRVQVRGVDDPFAPFKGKVVISRLGRKISIDISRGGHRPSADCKGNPCGQPTTSTTTTRPTTPPATTTSATTTNIPA